MTSFADQVFQMGGVPVGMSFPTAGNSYFLDPANGNDDNDGRSVGKAFKTLSAAEDALTADQNDVLYYLAGASSISLSALLTWDKSYTHLIGVCAPTSVGNRARIFQDADATALSPLIDITASGCIFKNIYVFQGVDDATSLINVQVTGARNYFENCHFAGGGHATQAIDDGASLALSGAAENLFKHCTIGVDTIAAATGMVGILFDTEARRNIFEDCHVSMLAGHTGAAFVEVADATGLDRYTIFKNCLFTNTNASNFSMASGFVIPATAGNRPARIFLKDCMSYGATVNDANDRGVLMGNMDVVTGADLSGVAVEMKT